MKIKLIEFNEETVIPNRAHHNDTGADVYLNKDVTLYPGVTQVIPLGIGLELPTGYSAHLQVRSSVAKKGIHVAQSAIDAGYRGQIHAIVTNISDEVQMFSKGDRLCYIVVYPVVYPEFTWENLDQRESGAFGSTGK